MATPALVDEATPDTTNAQRLVAGLGQSIVGPANIARALTGLSASLVAKLLGALYSLVRSWIAPPEVDPDRAITLSDGAPSRPGWRRPLLITLVLALVLAVGGVAVKLLRTPSAPPVAPEPPRVRPASGATGDSASKETDEVEEIVEIAVDEDPRKKGE